MAKYISCGKCNKYILYILLSVFFSCISTMLFGYGYCNESNSLKITQLYPEETKKIQESLSTHIIIHNIYRNLMILIISLILYKYEKNSIKSQKEESIEIKEIIEKFTNKSNFKKKLDRKSIVHIILIITLFTIQEILTILYFIFDLSYLDLFILELPLFSYFNYKILNVKIYKHHKFALGLSIIVCLTTKIMSLFAYAFSEDYKALIFNKHRFLYFIGIFSYIIIIVLRSYSVTGIKLFIDIKYISQNKILIVKGTLGILINAIIMAISSYKNCGTIDNIDIHLCNVLEDNSNNRDVTYLENVITYFNTLNYSIDIGRYYEVIIEVFISLIDSVSHYCYIYFYFLVIKHLTSFHTIFQSFTYSFTIRVLTIIISFISKKNFNKMELNTFTFIIATISDVCAAISIFVYLELIELNFCDFNLNLRWKIIERSEEDTDEDFNLFKNDSIDSIIFDENDPENKEYNVLSNLEMKSKDKNEIFAVKNEKNN